MSARYDNHNVRARADGDDDVLAHEDVLRCVYDFLHYCGYHAAVQALQVESGVPYNTIHIAAPPSSSSSSSLLDAPPAPPQRGHAQTCASDFAPPTPSGLERAVLEGSWAEVLHVYVDGLLLPFDTKSNVYEQILQELLYVHGLQPAARALLQHAPVFAELRRAAPARHARLARAVDEFDLVAWQEATQRGGGGSGSSDNDHQTHLHNNSGSSRAAMTLSHEDVLARRRSVLRQLRAAVHFRSAPYDHALTAALLRMQRPHHQHHHHNDNDEHSVRDDHDGDERGVGGKRARSPHDEASVAPPPAPALQLPYPLQAPRHVVRKLTYDRTRATTTATATAATRSHDADEHTRDAATATAMAAADEADGTTPSCVATRLGSSLLVVGRSDGVVDFVDASCGVVVGHTAAQAAAVLVLTLDVVVAGDGGAVVDVGDDNIKGDDNNNNDNDNATSAPRDDVWVAAGYRDGSVRLYDAQSHKLLRRFARVHDMGVTGVVFVGTRRRGVLAAHRPLLVSSAYDAALLLLDVAAGAVVCRVADVHHHTFATALLGIDDNDDSSTTTRRVATHRVDDSHCDYVLSAGNDGCLCCWRVIDIDADDDDAHALTTTTLPPPPPGTRRRLVQLTSGTSALRDLHSSFATTDAPTQLVALPQSSSNDDNNDNSSAMAAHCMRPSSSSLSSQLDVPLRCEALVATHTLRALLVQVSVRRCHRRRGGATSSDDADAVSTTLLCVLHASSSSSPLRRAAACVHVAVAPAPHACDVLSLYVSDAQGHILLYNVKAWWRDAAWWAQHGGGSMAVTQPTDESAAVIVDYGAPVVDLHVALATTTTATTTTRSDQSVQERQSVQQQATACDECARRGHDHIIVVAYAPALSTLYLLQ